MLRKRDEYIEYGYDTLSEEQQEAIIELKGKIEQILGKSFLHHLGAIEKALLARDKIKKVSPSLDKAISLGGVFVSLETVYVMLVITCSFCTQKDESGKIDNILALLEVELDKLNEMKERKANEAKH